ncbi:MAG: alanine racemase [Bacteroidales bacterium]
MNIIRPTLLIRKLTAKFNILRMVNKAQTNNIVFRPHFKTHRSAEIGEWFKEEGINKITVSSVEMASYFANHGWQDILIAFPVNLLEIDQINKLSSKIKLSLLVESLFSVNFLENNLKHTTDIYLKIDTGYHRTGIASNDISGIEEILYRIGISKNLNFLGFLTHAGNTYSAKSKPDIIKIHNESIGQLQVLKSYFESEYPNIICSIGDTPSCSLAEEFTGVDEIRPGNFVFYDVMQYYLGSCQPEEIAVCLSCPVVAKHPERNEIVIYGGAIHLSKDSVPDNDGNQIFGLVVKLNADGWGPILPDTYVSSLSQEHGIVVVSDHLFDQFNIGETIGILPVHSCLTANLMNDNMAII